MTDEFRISSLLQTVEILKKQIDDAFRAGLNVHVPDELRDYLQGTDNRPFRWKIYRPYNTKVSLGTSRKPA